MSDRIISEHRSVSLVDAEVKGRMFRGYAAVFDTPWNDQLIKETGYVEKVARGMFRKALAKGDNVPLKLIDHLGPQILGTTGSGNVKIREDGKGLLTQAKLPDNYLGEYARSMIEAGDLKGMSYGINVNPQRDTMMTRDNNIWTRTIMNAQKILDVTLTWEPAYTATTAELRTTGFVATPLQELVDGLEEQIDDAATEAPPDDEAWWGEKPADAAPTALATPWWETYAKELERRF
jgi:uncharacterized protein